MLSQRLMLVCTMEDMAMVLVWDMLDLDIPVLDMLDMEVMVLVMAVSAILVLVTMARGPLMLVFSMEPMDMVLVLDMDTLVLDMLDMVVMVLATAVLAMLVLATMARDLLMLSQRLMLVCIMVEMVLVWDMLDLDMDTPVLDMPDMVVMDSDMEDTVLVMEVPSMVKQLIYASKSS